MHRNILATLVATGISFTVFGCCAPLDIECQSTGEILELFGHDRKEMRARFPEYFNSSALLR